MRFPVGVIVGSASFRNHNSAPEVTVVSTEAMDWDSRSSEEPSRFVVQSFGGWTRSRTRFRIV
jgi:hypothetical protein